MNYLALLIPFAYLGILITSLATFSSLYRKRKVQKSLNLAPYFPPHTPRNIYMSLLHLSESSKEKATKVPDSLLRAALLARATEDIHRILEIRSRKQALATLLQRGVVGDEIWQRLLRAERELEEEVKDVVQEANRFSPAWGQNIFQSANEMAQNQFLKKKLAAISATVPVEKEWWERIRESIKEGFMKELEEDASATAKPTSGVDRKMTSATGVGKGGSSDEDAVLVETPAAGALGAGGGGGGGGKGRKKKGKK